MARYTVNGETHELDDDQLKVLDAVGVKYERVTPKISVNASTASTQFKLEAEQAGSTSWNVKIVGFSEPTDDFYMSTGQLVKFAHAVLNELDQQAPKTIQLGDPEPPRDAEYVDRQNDVWAYRNGTWGYVCRSYAGETVGEWTPMGPWKDACDFPWMLKTED